jgi:hypothetical protein
LNVPGSHISPQISPSDVKAAWSGIRPLVKDPSKPLSAKGTAQISREVREGHGAVGRRANSPRGRSFLSTRAAMVHCK